jgi:hypothetical protein
MIRVADGIWVHVSSDDWAAGDCYCTSQLARCVPAVKFRRARILRE